MRHFLKSESGVVSVEYVTWLPLILAVMMVGIDASLLLSKEAQLYDITREISRQYAKGVIDETEVDDFLEMLWPGAAGEGYTASVAPSGVDMVQVSVSIPYSQVMLFGEFFAEGRRLSAIVIMAVESIA